MRKRIYFSLLFIFIAVALLSLYETENAINKLTLQEAKNIYRIRKEEYNLMLSNKKNFLSSFAKFLASSKPIINGYLQNNQKIIINYVMPLYKNLYPKLITEIHFFKPPAISFVSFYHLFTKPIDVSEIRKDIVKTSYTHKPSVHFFICRHYVGLRAVYPIVNKNRLLGSLSFGVDIKTFQKMFNILKADVSIYLKDNLLKKYLSPKFYKEYLTHPLYNNYRVNGNVFNIKLSAGYEIKNKNVFTKIPIKDFYNQTIGYIVIKDSIKKAAQIIQNEALKKLFFLITSYLIILIIIFLLFEWIFRKLTAANEILLSIKKHKFDNIPQKVQEKDELDIYHNNLIEVANDLKSYINALTQKIQNFSDKAYQDGLTKVFNRTFLEEKQQDIHFKYKVSKTPLGIIMLDIDNFKHINDTFGHDIGDLVLSNLAKTIKTILRKNDIFIRYGGEEFLILIDDADIATTYKIAEKIRKTIEKISVHTPKGELHFTISIGVTILKPIDNNLFDAIKRADKNLYKAKKSGKNRVVI